MPFRIFVGELQPAEVECRVSFVQAHPSAWQRPHAAAVPSSRRSLRWVFDCLLVFLTDTFATVSLKLRHISYYGRAEPRASPRRRTTDKYSLEPLPSTTTTTTARTIRGFDDQTAFITQSQHISGILLPFRCHSDRPAPSFLRRH